MRLSAVSAVRKQVLGVNSRYAQTWQNVMPRPPDGPIRVRTRGAGFMILLMLRWDRQVWTPVQREVLRPGWLRRAYAARSAKGEDNAETDR